MRNKFSRSSMDLSMVVEVLANLPIRTFAIITLCLFGKVVEPGFAETDESLVRVVDIQKVISDSIVGKAAKSNLEEEIKKMEAKLSIDGRELTKQQEEIEKQKALISPEALSEKRDSLRKKQLSFERGVRDQRETFDKKNGEVIGKIVTEIRKVVAEIAEDRGFQFVLEKDPRVVVFMESRIDLTPDVIAELNKKKTAL